MNAPQSPLKLLLDSNIWLDFFLGERKGNKLAVQLISWAIERDTLLLYAASSVKDIYYLLGTVEKRKIRDRGEELAPSLVSAIDEYAWACIETMNETAVAVPIDQSDLWIASKLRAIHGDFEDDLILAAAKRARVDCLVTNDKALLGKSPVATLPPSDVFIAFG